MGGGVLAIAHRRDWVYRHLRSWNVQHGRSHCLHRLCCWPLFSRQGDACMSTLRRRQVPESGPIVVRCLPDETDDYGGQRSLSGGLLFELHERRGE